MINLIDHASVGFGLEGTPTQQTQHFGRKKNSKNYRIFTNFEISHVTLVESSKKRDLNSQKDRFASPSATTIFGGRSDILKKATPDIEILQAP